MLLKLCIIFYSFISLSPLIVTSLRLLCCLNRDPFFLLSLDLIFSWYLMSNIIIDLCSKKLLAGTISKFGAGLFLLVQVIILLDFTHSWNDAWVEKDEQKWLAKVHISHKLSFIATVWFLTFELLDFRYIALLVVSVACYLAAFTFSGILFIWFNPSGHDCGLNVFFIVMTMILAFAFAIIALHPTVRIRFYSSIHCCLVEHRNSSVILWTFIINIIVWSLEIAIRFTWLCLWFTFVIVIVS